MAGHTANGCGTIRTAAAFSRALNRKTYLAND
jgi:hypothetical protein